MKSPKDIYINSLGMQFVSVESGSFRMGIGNTPLPPELTDDVAWLKEQTDLPICIGFGISQPKHVELLGSVADGIIVGSAIVRQFADLADRSRADVVESIGEYVDSLLTTLNPAT